MQFVIMVYILANILYSTGNAVGMGNHLPCCVGAYSVYY